MMSFRNEEHPTAAELQRLAAQASDMRAALLKLDLSLVGSTLPRVRTEADLLHATVRALAVDIIALRKRIRLGGTP